MQETNHLSVMLRPKLWFAIILLSSAGLQAQPKWHWGLSYAPTFAQFEHYGSKIKQDRYGQQVCLQLYSSSERHFSYRMGIGYSFTQANYKYITPYLGDSQFTRFKHQDLLLPFQVQYGFRNKPNQLYLSAGLMPTLNLGRKAIETTVFTYSTGSNVRDITNEQGDKRLDLFLTIGPGYAYHFKKNGQCYIQPSVRSNMPVQLIYVVEYLFNPEKRHGPASPPIVNTFGVELGYYFQ